MMLSALKRNNIAGAPNENAVKFKPCQEENEFKFQLVGKKYKVDGEIDVYLNADQTNFIDENITIIQKERNPFGKENPYERRAREDLIVGESKWYPEIILFKESHPAISGNDTKPKWSDGEMGRAVLETTINVSENCQRPVPWSKQITDTHIYEELRRCELDINVQTKEFDVDSRNQIQSNIMYSGKFADPVVVKVDSTRIDPSYHKTDNENPTNCYEVMDDALNYSVQTTLQEKLGTFSKSENTDTYLIDKTYGSLQSQKIENKYDFGESRTDVQLIDKLNTDLTAASRDTYKHVGFVSPDTCNSKINQSSRATISNDSFVQCSGKTKPEH